MDKNPLLELEVSMLILLLSILEALTLESQMKCSKISKNNGAKIFMIWIVSLMTTSAKL